VVSSALLLGGLLFASLSLLTPQLWHLYLVFAAIGVVTTGASPVGYARAVSSWFSRHRGLALAIAISGGSLGGIVHPATTQTLLRIVGWRTTYAILGVAIVAIGVPLARRFSRDREATRARAATTADGVSVGDGLATRMFWILAVVVFCSSLAQSSTLVHLPALLSDRGSGVFLLSSADSLAMGALAAFLIGFGTSGETDVAPYLLSRYFGLRSFSTLYCLTWMSHAAAGAVGPVLMGRVFDATGSYEIVLMRLSLAAVSVAGLMLLMPRYDDVTGPRGLKAALYDDGVERTL
jgi:MFS family permease